MHWPPALVLADGVATRMAVRLIDACAARGQQMVPMGTRRIDLPAGLGTMVDPQCALWPFEFQPQLARGLQACDHCLLARDAASHVPTQRMAASRPAPSRCRRNRRRYGGIGRLPMR